ncbi:bifunctional diaminohydroxyphosphoribosylaminopyrimidine deaminase/5-amino-6-(5-phosphoribosylamino)uracil reductase RibD [Neorickettsia helminthoeca]|nr:bifunctional diaminohydroxyphosphoribosylaminopyrimidine deaminase/5-amino-6-(5-phosphoribosylamino)uracil reductase RibD [Neorickettsia helminthoeca]
MTLPWMENRILYYMRIAVNTSRTGLAFTSSNPSVGCVVVKDGEVVGRGVTGLNGIPHAEEIALRAAGKSAIGGDLYTTLEPCTHYGKTAPCVDKIIQSGIKRVYIGINDPDERVSGRGIEKLRENGIKVVSNVLKYECFSANIGYFYRQILGRPFVILKVATTLDGKIACSNGKSAWITSAKMRRIAHKLRAMTTATMVSYSTVKCDNPQLDCRLPGLEKESVKIILDSRAEIGSAELNLFKNGIVWSFGRKNSFKYRNFFNFECETVEDRVDLLKILHELGDMGINSLLVECGRKLFTSFLKENLFDQIAWFRANKIAGDDAVSLCGDLDFSDPSAFIKLQKTHEIKIDNESIDFFSCNPSLRFDDVLRRV